MEGYRMAPGVIPRKVGQGGEEPPWWAQYLTELSHTK